MAFKQGKKPCLVLHRGNHGSFSETLIACGYMPHNGPRKKRPGEFRAWKRIIGDGKQIHVQEVFIDDSDGFVYVYAHTEPQGYGITHLISAIRDKANFAHGARVLMRDLKKLQKGWMK